MSFKFKILAICTLLLGALRAQALASPDVAENGQALQGEGCSSYSLNMKKFKEVVSEERSSEVITELDDRGLALRLNFYKFEKEGDRDLVGIKQSNESIEESGIEMTTPVIKSILDVIFTQDTQNDDIRESDLVVCMRDLSFEKQIDMSIFYKMKKRNQIRAFKNDKSLEERIERMERMERNNSSFKEEIFRNEEEPSREQKLKAQELREMLSPLMEHLRQRPHLNFSEVTM